MFPENKYFIHFWCDKYINTSGVRDTGSRDECLPNKFLLLTEFEVRTGSYGPSFFPSIYGPSVKRVGHKSKEEKRGSVTYSTHRENEVNKIFIISLLSV